MHWGWILHDETDCTLAPSVADAYQSQGLGSLMMQHLLGLLPRLGRQRMLLWGGVRADNPRAVHFYTKFGFQRVGDFEAGGTNNYDMIADLVIRGDAMATLQLKVQVLPRQYTRGSALPRGKFRRAGVGLRPADRADGAGAD